MKGEQVVIDYIDRSAILTAWTVSLWVKTLRKITQID